MNKKLINNKLVNFNGRYTKTSINIRPSELEFLKSTGYSVTAIFRKAINDLINNKSHDDIKELIAKQERMAKLIRHQAEFMNRKDLADQFGLFQDNMEKEELKGHKVIGEKEVGKVLDNLKAEEIVK